MIGSRQLRQHVSVAVGAALLLAIGSACAVVGQDSGRPNVLIAADLQLTGDDSELGRVFENALRLQVEQANEQRLLGDDRRLELVVRDNRSDSGTSAVNFAELADDPEVSAVIMGGCSACALATAELADERRVPTVVLAAADAVSEPVEERRYTFKLGPDAGDTAATIAAELAQAEAETVGLITVDDAYGQDGERELASLAERSGFEVAVTEHISAAEDRLRAAAAAVADYQPEPADPFGQPVEESEPALDAVVVWGRAPLAGQFATHLREAGYRGPLLLDMTAIHELYLYGTEQALDGSSLVFTDILAIDQVMASSPARAVRQQWFRDYAARYGTYHAQASWAADAVRVIIDAITRVEAVDRDGLRDALESTRVDGLTGQIRFTADQHSGLHPSSLQVLTARNSRWSLG